MRITLGNTNPGLLDPVSRVYSNVSKKVPEMAVFGVFWPKTHLKDGNVLKFYMHINYTLIKLYVKNYEAVEILTYSNFEKKTAFSRFF